MHAIILAAGCGKRMGELTADHPKALLKLHHQPLIEWQMQALESAGVHDISIVKGYQEHVFRYPVKYFMNPRWNNTNMLYTLLCADEWLSSYPCIISYSDIVYTDEAVSKLLNCKGDLAITYDPYWKRLWEQRFEDPLSDAEIFKYSNNHLLDIGGRTHNIHDIQGQYMGLIKFSVEGWKQVKLFLDKLSQETIDTMDMTALFKLMLKNNVNIEVAAIDSTWCEIDNSHDYKICQQLFLNFHPAPVLSTG